MAAKCAKIAEKSKFLKIAPGKLHSVRTGLETGLSVRNLDSDGYSGNELATIAQKDHKKDRMEISRGVAEGAEGRDGTHISRPKLD